ncbi:MAG: hypothetical protein K6T75_03940 [Acetobacteraceae bacterium]|nr:hypothetical protein [Acetobacteraceae bacterium]
MIAEGVTLACPFVVRRAEGVFLMWEVTRQCNYRCRHCITSAGDAAAAECDPGTLLHLAGQMAGLGVAQVYLTGGEPLLKEGAVPASERVVILRHVVVQADVDHHLQVPQPPGRGLVYGGAVGRKSDLHPVTTQPLHHSPDDTRGRGPSGGWPRPRQGGYWPAPNVLVEAGLAAVGG